MYKDKKVIHIVARGMNGEIGRDNKLLWSIPEELKYFKEQTLGHVVLFGSKTFDNLPKPLSRRITTRVTRCPNKESAFGRHLKMDVEDYLEDSLHIADSLLNTDCIFVAGGGQLYNATAGIVDKLLITEVDKEYHDADAFYTQPEGFEMTNKSEWRDGVDFLSGDIARYRFTTWHRLPF